MKRRDEGSVFKRSGKWFARLRYTTRDGQPREKKRTAPTEAKAKSLIADLRAEVAADLSDRKTYRQLDAFYRKQFVHAARFVGGQKVSGFRQDLRILERYLDAGLEFFGDRPLDEIRYSHIANYKNEILDRPVMRSEMRGKERVPVATPRSVADVNQHLRRLRRVFNVAVEQGWLAVNPFKQGRPLILDSHERERTRTLSEHEERRLLAECTHDSVRAAIIFAIETGVRLGELQRVRWSHVDLPARIIRVEATTTKTLKPRMVPISSRLAGVLASLRAAPVLRHSPYIFGGVSFRKAFEGARRRAGIPDLHFHDLRHTAITRMLEAGIAPPLVMKISGHTQQKTFLRYVNQSEAGMLEIAQTLDRRAAMR